MKLIKISENEEYYQPEFDFESKPEIKPEIKPEPEILHTDPKTGRPINYIKSSDVERVLDSFIVDTLSGSTLSKRFALEFSKKNKEKDSLVGMRMVKHPYTRYNLTPELREELKNAIKNGDIAGLQSIFQTNNAQSLKRKVTPRPKRWLNPNRPRRTRRPVTKMQVIRDLYGLVGIYDLTKAKNLASEAQNQFGQYFSHREMDLIKSMVLTDAYVNIYPNSVSKIRGNGKIWIVNDDIAEKLAKQGINPELS